MTTLPTTVAAGSSGHLTHHEELHKGHNAGTLVPFTLTGNAVVGAGIHPIRVGFPFEIFEAFLDAATAPTGAALIVNIRKSGVAALAGAARPRLNAGEQHGGVMAMNIVGNATDWLTADVEQIGSSVAGADVTLVLRLRST